MIIIQVSANHPMTWALAIATHTTERATEECWPVRTSIPRLSSPELCTESMGLHQTKLKKKLEADDDHHHRPSAKAKPPDSYARTERGPWELKQEPVGFRQQGPNKGPESLESVVLTCLWPLMRVTKCINDHGITDEAVDDLLGPWNHWHHTVERALFSKGGERNQRDQPISQVEVQGGGNKLKGNP